MGADYVRRDSGDAGGVCPDGNGVYVAMPGATTPSSMSDSSGYQLR
jgi:hypothetical protein